ncbi:MAG: hypothetical protein M3313_12140 [Actinomycetota bacterium]|nr:hypothetical protein [Actinomycetota bacterium]
MVSGVRARLGWWEAAIVGYAGLAALCRPLTVPAAIAVLLAGAALAVAAARGPIRSQPLPGPTRAAFPWLGLAVLLAGWEVTAMLWGNDRTHPTLSLLLDPVLDTYPGRFVGYLAWLGAGRWLVTR